MNTTHSEISQKEREYYLFFFLLLYIHTVTLSVFSLYSLECLLQCSVYPADNRPTRVVGLSCQQFKSPVSFTLAHHKSSEDIHQQAQSHLPSAAKVSAQVCLSLHLEFQLSTMSQGFTCRQKASPSKCYSRHRNNQAN